MNFIGPESFFLGSGLPSLVSKVGKAVIPADCPQATVLHITGLNKAGDIVYQGTANKSQGWAPVEDSPSLDMDALFAETEPAPKAESKPKAEAESAAKPKSAEKKVAASTQPAASSNNRCKIDEDSDVATDRFEEIGDGTVLDRKYGLLWTQCPVGMTYHDGHCLGSPSQITWKQADRYHEKLPKLQEFNTWVLPSHRDIQSIVAAECGSKSLNSDVFPFAVSGNYWGRLTVGRDEAELILSDDSSLKVSGRASALYVTRFRVAEPDWD